MQTKERHNEDKSMKLKAENRENQWKKVCSLKRLIKLINYSNTVKGKREHKSLISGMKQAISL